MKRTVLLTLVMGMILNGMGWAVTNYVVTPGTPGVTPTANYTSWGTAATNIQDAIDVVGSGGVVLVTNGTYVLTNMLSIANTITVRSFNNGAIDSRAQLPRRHLPPPRSTQPSLMPGDRAPKDVQFR